MQSMKSYCVHKIPDAALHLSTYPPMQRQYPSSLRWLKGKKVSCFQTLRPFFVCGQELMTFHQDGRPALIVMKGHKPWIMYDGAEYEAHIWDCSEVITGGGGF